MLFVYLFYVGSSNRSSIGTLSLNQRSQFGEEKAEEVEEDEASLQATQLFLDRYVQDRVKRVQREQLLIRELQQRVELLQDLRGAVEAKEEVLERLKRATQKHKTKTDTNLHATQDVLDLQDAKSSASDELDDLDELRELFGEKTSQVAVLEERIRFADTLIQEIEGELEADTEFCGKYADQNEKEEKIPSRRDSNSKQSPSPIARQTRAKRSISLDVSSFSKTP